MKLKTLIVDARTLIFINNLSLVIIGMLFLKMQRTWTQIIFGLMCSLVTEFLFLYFLKKQRRFHWHQFSSSIVTGVGLVLVIQVVDWWVYGLLSAIGIASKYLLKKNERDHLFNPANFAIVFFIAIASASFIRIYSDQFAMSKYILYQVLIMGFLISYLVDRLVLVTSYMASFFAWGLLVDRFQLKMNYYDIVGSEIGVGSLIFLFFMITDPRTSPRSRKAQLIWGVFIASLCVFLKYHEVYYNRFIALFIATTLGVFYDGSKRASGKIALKEELAAAA